MGNVMTLGKNGRYETREARDDDPMPLNMDGRIRSFTFGQVKLLRRTGSKIVSVKATNILNFDLL